MPIYQSVEIYNPTDIHFSGTWDNEVYAIAPKSSIFVPPFLANHLAKHLINQILQLRYNAMCKKHDISTDETLKSCNNCRERNAKLTQLHITPDRAELLKDILRPQTPEVPIASAPPVNN